MVLSSLHKAVTSYQIRISAVKLNWQRLTWFDRFGKTAPASNSQSRKVGCDGIIGSCKRLTQ